MLVLLVPLCALAVFSALGVRTRLSVLTAHEHYAELARPSAALSSLSTTLEQESVASAWFVATDGAEGVGELEEARAETDDAVAELEAAVPGFEAAEIGEDTNRVLASLGDRLETLGPQRDRIDERVEGPAETRNYFLSLDDHAIEVAEHMARELADRQVSAGLFGLVDLHRAAQASAREAAIVVPALATGAISATERAEFGAAVDAQTTYRSRFASIASDEEQRAVEQMEDRNRTVINRMSPPQAATLLSRLPAVTVTASEWYDLDTRKATVLGDGIAVVRGVVSDTAGAEESSARDDVALYAVGALLAIGLAVGIALIVARQTTKPLTALTRAAQDVSQRQLPQLVDSMRRGSEPALDGIAPIRTTARDEIGELGRAFNAIQSVAVEVAREQSALLRRGISDLFVNLARRNQSLLDRQIELIDRLEADEQDPDVLQAMFQLDHLATRMRRNAESLLVLADAEQIRRWHEPIPLLDVVRGATAEIADFARVSITGLDQQLAVSGHAAADLTHLMAELLENATSFSPPHTPVTVHGVPHRDGVVLAVTDQGLGMPDDRLAEANQLLADPPAAGLALSRILGLYVVGHLAARHGIVVELRPGGERGLTALVAIPGSVLAGGASDDTAPPVAAAAAGEPHGNGHAPIGSPNDQPEPAAPFWSVDAWVASLFDAPSAGDGTAAPPALGTGDGAADPAPVLQPSDLTARDPGRNLLHLPLRRDGLIDVGDPSLIAEPGRSRAEEVRNLLSDHRRGIERADAVAEAPQEDER
ncbi:MAG: nitrate- and nitrite sensing domain-containing protein [Actinomycetota bacterium]